MPRKFEVLVGGWIDSLSVLDELEGLVMDWEASASCYEEIDISLGRLAQ